MPSKPKFPPSPEIKRVLSAALSVGVNIAQIEVSERTIRIWAISESDSRSHPALTPYEIWKAESETTD